MKSRKQVKRVLLCLFVGEIFFSQLIAFSVINYWGAYMLAVGCILLTALVSTVLFCTEYLLLCAIYWKLRKKSSGKSIGDEVYEMFNTH